MKDKLIKQFINSWSDEYAEDFHQIAKKIWEISELSMQEYGSAKILMDKLKENGFTIEAEVADMPTAFIATYGQSSPVIGINAEYDALPGLSQKSDSMKKEALIESGPGHGCGHNLLGTASVKAAIAIKNAMDKFKLHGTVKVIGAPAEELCLGKPLLRKAGLLENFDAFLDWHPWSYNRANYDSCCAYFSVKYHYTGRTCHGNSPWHGRSALDAAILQSHGVEMLREHIYPGCPPDAANTINYTFTSIDPEFPSVVPDKATAWYIGRFITIEDAENGLKRITNCAKGAALSTETEVKVELITATHHKIPNKTLAQLVHNNFQEIGAPKFTEEEHEIAKKIQKEIGVKETGLAAEIEPFDGGYTVVCDTSEYSWHAPYASPWIAMGPENAGWHHWGVTLCASRTMGEKSMDTASKVIAYSAIDLMCNPKLVQEAKKEFKDRMKGRKYKCLLPDDYQSPVTLNADIMKKYMK